MRWLRAAALVTTALACGCSDGVVAQRGAEAGAAAAGEEGNEPQAMAGSTNRGGTGNFPGDGGAGETGASTTTPTPAQAEPCSEHPTTVVQGMIGGAAIDHGFCRIEARSVPLATDLAFGDDGYLHARWSDSEKIATGLLRLPRSAASDGGWYCIEEGTATEVSADLLRLELTSLSRLDLESAGIDAEGALAGSADNEESAPIDGGSYHQRGFGKAFIQLPVAGDHYGPSWRLLGFKPYPDGRWPDPTQPYGDVVLVDYGDGTSPLRVALPGPGSTILREEDAKQDVLDTQLDLRDVTEPVACPGTKIDGKLVVYFR